MPRKKRDGSPMFAPQRPAHGGRSRALCRRSGGDGDRRDAGAGEGRRRTCHRGLRSAAGGDSVAEAAAAGCAARVGRERRQISHTTERGNRAATEAAFAQAAHIVKRRYVITRVHAQYMEPRGAIGTYDPAEDRYTLYADVNYPHRVRNMLANMVFKVPESQVRVVCHDVGGGFGAKGWQYVEHRLTLWAARKLDRPVKWRCERSEVMLADEHGRDNVGTIELAFDANAKIIGLRLHMLASIGAYIASDRQLLTPFGQIGTVVGMYDIPAACVTIDAVLSNTSPTAPYRGAGRPEASYLIERAMEAAAQRTADRSDRTAPPQYHSADAKCRTRRRSVRSTIAGSSAATWRWRWKRRTMPGSPRAARRRAHAACCVAIGFANAIEQAAGPTPEYAEIRFNPSGSAILLMGTKTHGQGHETAFKQILCETAGHRSEGGAVHRRRHRSRRFRHGLERLAFDGGRRCRR